MLDSNGIVFDELQIEELEMMETRIIEKSKKIYNTPEPCIIYRTCIINEMHSQIKKNIEKRLDTGEKSITKKDLLKEVPDLILPERCEKIIKLLV